MRKKIVAGNWKMNMTLSEGLELAGSIINYYQRKDSLKTEVVLCAPFIHLALLAKITTGSKILCGAQNCASEASGAYTGEVSAEMIKSTGTSHVIIRHSIKK
jgi:triosephosphate isomerase